MPSYRIAQATKDNVHLIPDLVFSVYGHTYEAPMFYGPEQILASLTARERLLFLAMDDQDRLRGCLGLKFPFPTRAVGFFSTFLVDPAIRGLDSGYIFRDLALAIERAAVRLSREEGLHVIMSSEVTMHPLSQRYITAYDFHNCGIYLAWSAAWASRERLDQFGSAAQRSAVTGSRQTFQDRRAEVVSARVISGNPPRRQVFFPLPFAELLREIYAALKLPADEGGSSPLPAGETVLEERMDYLRGLATIEVRQVGQDSAEQVCERIDHHCYGMADLVHVYLPLFQADLNGLVAALMAKGCRFCMVIPVYREGDVLVLQYLNRVPDLLTENNLVTPLGRRILQVATGTPPSRGTAPQKVAP